MNGQITTNRPHEEEATAEVISDDDGGNSSTPRTHLRTSVVKFYHQSRQRCSVRRGGGQQQQLGPPPPPPLSLSPLVVDRGAVGLTVQRGPELWPGPTAAAAVAEEAAAKVNTHRGSLSFAHLYRHRLQSPLVSTPIIDRSNDARGGEDEEERYEPAFATTTFSLPFGRSSGSSRPNCPVWA